MSTNKFFIVGFSCSDSVKDLEHGLTNYVRQAIRDHHKNDKWELFSGVISPTNVVAIEIHPDSPVLEKLNKVTIP